MSEQGELERMTAAGGTLELGGRTFLVKRLTLGDFGQVKVWLKSRMKRPFQAVAEALQDLEPLRQLDPAAYEKCRAELLQGAMADNKRLEGGVVADEADINAALASAEGLSLLLWLAIRKEHRDVTLEWVRAAVEAEDFLALQDKIEDLHLFGDEDEEDDEEHWAKRPGTPGGPPLVAGADGPPAAAPNQNRKERRAARGKKKRKPRPA